MNPLDQPDPITDPDAKARNRALRLLLHRARGEHDEVAAVGLEATREGFDGECRLILAVAHAALGLAGQVVPLQRLVNASATETDSARERALRLLVHVALGQTAAAGGVLDEVDAERAEGAVAVLLALMADVAGVYAEALSPEGWLEHVEALAILEGAV